ncbi:hypothetical protein HPB50_017080 [Hyalomma asiaticum]|uniref:Uncharacterized protein n=1 Tax=Hyalomma asiaticum TaxID=266040 RepID=A0ACB7TJ49_HYAAI|nr:hypothetical protein HPB50_017080 [Hyalomma asiaticum]
MDLDDCGSYGSFFFGFLVAHEFHLQKGYYVSNAQAARTLGNKKGKLVCKDTVQALWISSVLATRSVSDNVAPKKRALGKLPKQQLTPEKVDVVASKFPQCTCHPSGNMQP